MTKERETPSGERPAFLARWEIVILLLALVISLVSLWMSIRADVEGSAPNVQLQSVEGSRGHMGQIENGEWTGEELTIRCTAVIKNFGNSPVQIVNVRWEPISIGEPMQGTSPWIAISDREISGTDASYQYFYEKRNNPVLGIGSPTLLAGEEKTLYIRFQGNSILQQGQDTPNVRVVLVLSTGDELTILPEIKYSGVGF